MLILCLLAETTLAAPYPHQRLSLLLQVIISRPGSSQAAEKARQAMAQLKLQKQWRSERDLDVVATTRFSFFLQ